MSAPRVRIEERLSAVLRGDLAAASLEATGLDPLLEAASSHGVRLLLADRVASSRGTLPPPAVSACRRDLLLAAALEVLRQRELSDVLEALAREGLQPILLKGASLAYTVYPSPALRPRFDVDLLVRREEMEPVAAVMTARGYRRPGQVTGELVMHQVDYARRDAHGVWHVYDYHWKLANRHAVADVLSYDELARGAVPLPPLGAGARGLGPVHALVLACVHRVAHHTADERLIWLYDIHLLSERLSPAEARAFASLAAERAVSAVCADGLERARRHFGTRLPEGLLDGLRACGAERREPSAVFLQPDYGRLHELMSDLRALPRWSRRLRLILEHAFPPPAYMTGTYMVSHRAWLPALYTHRILRGAWRWLRGGCS